MRRRMLAVTFFHLILFGAGLIFSMATAHADPMCGPMNGPGGFLWPQVQTCILPVPQMGGLIRYPTLGGGGSYADQFPPTVPYIPQVPQFVPLPPIPPGLLP